MTRDKADIFDEYFGNEYNPDDIYCPICGNPLVDEKVITVCYYCGWSEDELEE